MNSRRQFIRLVPLAGAGLLIGPAWSQAMVDEKDPTATSLAYHADASKVDKAKQPKYVAGAACANCALYQGKAGAAAGPCPIFAGKQVAAKGWCSAYVKKA
ncbi:high-potential iron-sulfur protein [Roseateles amylovorans]|uniref:High-potential iron-sulfur protein n=1 Tax=Roseateles amylovorans TaxID=2978473 RepID=A0ABY6B0U8_9BURK|nr:high-potential iron-sulfur protein [Roseateles amylovorans]UXH78572.1 high-potential iron-sulfur protein [Roseateles amylovorans]